jgi:uncharacterized protein Yka (UPF0111/DUF47 family)
MLYVELFPNFSDSKQKKFLFFTWLVREIKDIADSVNHSAEVILV